jgi:hypothetical protein
MKTISWHWLMDKRFMNVLLLFGLIALSTACTDETDLNSPSSNASDKGKVGTFDAPIISCVDANATQTSITIRVTAGATGAPAGFSLHWMTKEALDALNGVWPSSESGLMCAGSFSGNANGHVFNLSPGEYTELTIGDVLFDTPGASTSCTADLLCGTQYVFRAFAHATSTMFKSGWSANQTCSTDACVENCVYGQGYWQRHGPVPPGGAEVIYTWPQSVKDNGLMLGTVNYTPLQLQNILNATGGTNGLVKLAHQLIAAKINVANGADATTIASTIAAADALIGGLVIPPVGSGSLTNAQVAALNNALEAYNSGDGGVEYCQ